MEGKFARMGKDNFYKLCGELRRFIERKITKMRLPVSVETFWFGLNGWIGFVQTLRNRVVSDAVLRS